jgi:hypothetical protein
MIRIPIAPIPGLVTDNTTYDDKQRVFDMSGLRWREGRLETLGGYASQTALTGRPTVNILGWSNAGVFTTAYGCDTGLYTATGVGTVTQRRPAALAGIQQWSLAAWGSTLLAVPSGQTYQLMAWTGGATAAYVATAPASCTVMVVTPQRQVMMLGTNEESGGAFNGRCSRWSDIEDYTDWTTAADNNAGEHIIDDASDYKAAAVLGDDVVALTGNTLWHITYLGLPGQTYKFTKIAETIGPPHKNLLCVMHGVAYWWGSDLKMRRWAPGSPIDEMACPVTREMRNYLYATVIDRMFIAPLYREEEIWLFYGDSRDGMVTSASRYIGYCNKESELAGAPVWIKGALARSAMLDAGDNGVIMANWSGVVYLHELTTTVWNDGWTFYLGDFYLNEAGNRAYLQRFIPDFEVQTATASLGILLRARPGDTGSGPTNNPFSITTATRQVPFRGSGMIMNMSLSGTGAFRMGKCLFEAEVGGER